MKLSDITEQGGVGVVAANKKQAKDPRYSTSMTGDIKPGETAKQAAKFGNKLDKKGMPPLLREEELAEKALAKKDLVGDPAKGDVERKLPRLKAFVEKIRLNGEFTTIDGKTVTKVESKTITKVIKGSKGNEYIVTGSNGKWTCTCPGFQFRHSCKHTSE